MIWQCLLIMFSEFEIEHYKKCPPSYITSITSTTSASQVSVIRGGWNQATLDLVDTLRRLHVSTYPRWPWFKTDCSIVIVFLTAMTVFIMNCSSWQQQAATLPSAALINSFHLVLRSGSSRGHPWDTRSLCCRSYSSHSWSCSAASRI